MSDDIEEAKARLALLTGDLRPRAGPVEGDIGPPPEGPVPVVGEPGWVPASPTGKVTTTELVAALQHRYPDDPEVRALVAKVTASGAEVVAANERCARAVGEANGLAGKLATRTEALGEVLRVLGAAAGSEGAGPGLDGVACKHLVDEAQRTMAGEADE